MAESHQLRPIFLQCLMGWLGLLVGRYTVMEVYSHRPSQTKNRERLRAINPRFYQDLVLKRQFEVSFIYDFSRGRACLAFCHGEIGPELLTWGGTDPTPPQEYQQEKYFVWLGEDNKETTGPVEELRETREWDRSDVGVWGIERPLVMTGPQSQQDSLHPPPAWHWSTDIQLSSLHCFSTIFSNDISNVERGEYQARK